MIGILIVVAVLVGAGAYVIFGYWGLLPHWAKDEKLAFSTFNARSEDFTTKPAFRDAWTRGQRCLVVTDGFYEWKRSGPKRTDPKQAHAIAMADDQPMLMAGLWASWRNPANGEQVLSCTVLTCAPNAVMGELRDRMPCILGEADWPAWLGETPATPAELLALLKPCPDDWLKIWKVDNKVGNVRNRSRPRHMGHGASKLPRGRFLPEGQAPQAFSVAGVRACIAETK